jgi:hypothetical protein
MGAKRRLMDTKPGRGHVSREVLDRYAVVNPTTFEALRFEEAQQAAARQKQRAAKQQQQLQRKEDAVRAA